MNVPSIILIVLVAVWFVWAAIRMMRNKGCACGGCTAQNHCENCACRSECRKSKTKGNP